MFVGTLSGLSLEIPIVVLSGDPSKVFNSSAAFILSASLEAELLIIDLSSFTLSGFADPPYTLSKSNDPPSPAFVVHPFLVHFSFSKNQTTAWRSSAPISPMFGLNAFIPPSVFNMFAASENTS